MITLCNWMASIPPEDKLIAYVGEGESVQRQFLLTGDGWETYSDWSFHLDMAFDLSCVTEKDSWERETVTQTQTESTTDTGSSLTASETKETRTVTEETVADVPTMDIASLAKDVTEEGLRLTWTVRRQQTQLPGRLRATLRALGPNEEVKKSAIMLFEVQPAVIAEAAAVVPVSEFEEMEQRLGELVSVAEQISAHIDRTAMDIDNDVSVVDSSRNYIVSAEVAVKENATLAQAAADTATAAAAAAAASEKAAYSSYSGAASERTMAWDCAQQAGAQCAMAGVYRDEAASYADEAKSAADTAVQQVKSQMNSYLNAAADIRDETAAYADEARTALEAALIDGTATGRAVRLDEVAVGNPITVTVSGVDDPTAVTVKQFGKNLNSLVFDDFAVVGTSENLYVGGSSPMGSAAVVDTYAAATQYAVSVEASWGDDITSDTTAAANRLLWCCVSYADGTSEYVNIINVGTVKAGAGSGRFYFTTAAGKTVKSIDFRKTSRWTGGTITLNNLQVELGVTATDYEAYMAPVHYTPAADGSVEGIIPLPTVTFIADTDGATVSCAYTKDATVVVAGLLKRIVALEMMAASAAVIPELL